MAVHVKSGKRAPLIEDPEGTFVVHDTGQGMPSYEYVGKLGSLLAEPGEKRFKNHFADCAQAAQHRRPR